MSKIGRFVEKNKDTFIRRGLIFSGLAFGAFSITSLLNKEQAEEDEMMHEIYEEIDSDTIDDEI